MVSRAVRNWLQLGLQVCLVLGGLALVQIVAERSNRRFDLTPTRALSLSGVTDRVLAEVERPLAITVFYRRGSRQRYAELLERVRTANPLVTYELFDLDRYPGRARGLGITEYGRAAIEYDGRRVTVPALPEEQLAGGILRALRGRRRRLVFTVGHGERAPGGGAESYGRLMSALESENYAPESVSLVADPVPADADALVVAGPERDFLMQELDAVAEYLKAGGGVLVLVDPGSLPNVARFLSSLGVRLGDDFIVDHERRVLGTDGLAAVIEQFRRGNPVSDPAANPIESGIVLPSARTVDVMAEVPGVRAESIARTAPTAWAMADPARARRGAEPSRAAHDRQGPVSVAVVAVVGSNGETEGRLVVVGDADFASDAYVDLLGNRDLAMNAVAWVAGEETLAGTRDAAVPEIIRPLSPLVLTERQARGILLLSVVVLPGIVLGTGVAVVGFARRRG